MRLGTVLDHKRPVQDGGQIHCREDEVWHLCNSCHGWKLNLENFARRTRQTDQIVQWCDDPSSRPKSRGDLNARRSVEE